MRNAATADWFHPLSESVHRGRQRSSGRFLDEGWNGAHGGAFAAGEEDEWTAMKEGRAVVARYARAVLAIGAMTVLAGTQALAGTPPRIGIKEFKYAPSVLSVPVGTTVTWINHDEEPHTVTSATGAFASPGLVNEETFAQVFRTKGTYQYFCSLHPHMKATVVVK
jgi:plastocyanin